MVHFHSLFWGLFRIFGSLKSLDLFKISDISKLKYFYRSMEAQQVVVMRVEANLEEEKVRNEEYLTVMRKYEERLEEMEVRVSPVLVSVF